jgi:tetratricopeptide (TPR) repeat protein
VGVALTRALAKSPDERYATCTEFVNAFAVALAGPMVRSASTVRAVNIPVPRTLAQGKPSNAGWWLAGLAALVLIASGVALWRPWVRPLSSVAVKPVVQPKTEPAIPDPDMKAAQKQLPGNPIAVAVPPLVPPVVKAEPRKESPPPTSTPEPTAEPTATKAGPIAEEFRRGQEQLKAGEYQAAIQAFTSVIAQQPKRAQAYHYRGEAHQLLMENEAAIKDYGEAIRLKPEDPFPYLERGVCLVRLQRDDEAFADFNRALEIRANLPVALNGRGGILLRRRQYENAIRDFTAAIGFNPNSAVAYRNRASAKQALGDKAGAKADREAAANAKKGEP